MSYRTRPICVAIAAFLLALDAAALADGELPFDYVRDALDGDPGAIERLSSCAADNSDCALAAAAALRRVDRPGEAAKKLEAAFARGSRTAAIALAELAFANGAHAAAHTWSRVYLEVSQDPDALETSDAERSGNRGAWLAHKSRDGLDDRALEAARRKAGSLTAQWPPEREPAGTTLGTTKRVNPEYPMELALKGLGGWAVVAAAIGPEGDVEEVRELLGSHPKLIAATRKAVEQWRFEPNPGGSWWTTRVIEYNLAASAETETSEVNLGEMDEQGWYRFDGSGGHIEFAVKVNGVPARAILDTGADTTVISAALAERAGIEMRDNGNVRIHGMYGDSLVPQSGKFQLKFANIDLPLVDVPIAPSPWFDVILARGLFELAVVQIDYPNQRIRFLDRDVVDFDGNVRTRRGRSGEPLVQAEVGGKKAWMLFDTGNAGTCLFKSRFVKRNDLDRFEIDNPGVIGGGVVASSQMQTIQIPEFRLGPYPFETLLARYTDGTDEGSLEGRTTRTGSRILRDRTRYDGILGHEVLKNFVVTTDLKERKINLALP